MAAGRNFVDTAPTLTFTWDTDFYTEKLNFRFLQEPKIMHSCDKTHTYVLDTSVLCNGADSHPILGPILNDDALELLWDLERLHNTPLPFGQIVFLSYYKNGTFYLESSTEKFKSSLVKQAFQSFGYNEVRMNGDYIYVSEKDTFKLKLKYGI